MSATTVGPEWRNYLCEYVCPEGNFGFYITAISHEHAQLMLDDLKGSAFLKGEVMATIKEPSQ